MRLRKGLFWLALLTLFLGGCIDQAQAHPTAQTLIANFQSNRADFEQLRQMFLADEGLERVADDFTRPEDPTSVGISDIRLQEYRALFDKLDLTAGIEGYGDKDELFFIASTQGLSVSGSGKGYAYLAGEPERVVEAIDRYRPSDGRSFTAYQPIEGNWYLYYDYED